MKKLFTGIGIVLGLALVGGFGFYIFCLNHVDLNEIGIAYNSADGQMKIQATGWHITSPMVRVTYLPTVPIQVDTVHSSKVITAKMVCLNTNGVHELIRLQGFSYSLGTGFNSIMKGYAFSGNKYPFLDILQEAGPEKARQ
jgi:hypothetical protein